MKPSASSTALPALAVAVCALLAGCGDASPAASPTRAPRAAASPATPCTVAADLPATLAITSGSAVIDTTLRDSPAGCARHVRYDVVKDGAFLMSARPVGDVAQWRLTAEDGPGVYAARFAWGYSGDYLAVSGRDSEAMTVKYGASLSAWEADRSRRTRTVRLSVRVDDFDAAGAGRGAGRTVVFEQRKGSVWRAVATDRADRTGVAAVRVRSARSGVWRAVLRATDASWGATSAAHRA